MAEVHDLAEAQKKLTVLAICYGDALFSWLYNIGLDDFQKYVLEKYDVKYAEGAVQKAKEVIYHGCNK